MAETNWEKEADEGLAWLEANQDKADTDEYQQIKQATQDAINQVPTSDTTTQAGLISTAVLGEPVGNLAGHLLSAAAGGAAIYGIKKFMDGKEGSQSKEFKQAVKERAKIYEKEGLSPAEAKLKATQDINIKYSSSADKYAAEVSAVGDKLRTIVNDPTLSPDEKNIRIAQLKGTTHKYVWGQMSPFRMADGTWFDPQGFDDSYTNPNSKAGKSKGPHSSSAGFATVDSLKTGAKAGLGALGVYETARDLFYTSPEEQAIIKAPGSKTGLRDKKQMDEELDKYLRAFDPRTWKLNPEANRLLDKAARIVKAPK